MLELRGGRVSCSVDIKGALGAVDALLTCRERSLGVIVNDIWMYAVPFECRESVP